MARDSSTPPGPVPKAVWGAVTAVLMALAAYLTALAKDHREPESAPRTTSVPAVVPPLGKPDTTPTTDEGVIAARTLEARLNPVIAELGGQVAACGARVVVLEQEVRALNARLIALRAAKAPHVRKDFEDDSASWTLPRNATLVDVERRRALEEALPQQWR